MPNERMTNHSLRARNLLLSGICQCCQNRSLVVTFVQYLE